MNREQLRPLLPKFELKATGAKQTGGSVRAAVTFTVHATGVRKENPDGKRAE